MREDTLQQLPGKAVNYTKLQLRIIFAVVFATCVLTLGCTTSSKPLAEAPPSAPAVRPDPAPEMAKMPPPEPHEVQEAVKRVFKESALVDTSHKPSFVTGDFNGDQSQDLAVVLRPDSARIADLNAEFPSWILRDLSGSKESGPRLPVGADDVLLAVIHGYGDKGWRDAQATQTFLLKNAAGSNMETQSTKAVLAANQGRKVPSLHGDVVAEVLDGKSGYLYYGPASYAWYDPKTFAGDPELRRMHGSGKSRLKQ